MDNIDLLTLECFVNRGTYGKYLSKKDPSKTFADEDYLRKLEKHESAILERTKELLSDRSIVTSVSVKEAFEIYTKEIIREIELKDNSKIYDGSDNEEDDTLFPDLEPDQEEDLQPTVQPVGKSYWGKEKVTKATSSASAADSFFLRRRSRK
jgi:hypothetical protein